MGVLTEHMIKKDYFIFDGIKLFHRPDGRLSEGPVGYLFRGPKVPGTAPVRTTTHVFKARLKTHLFRLAFNIQ